MAKKAKTVLCVRTVDMKALNGWGSAYVVRGILL